MHVVLPSLKLVYLSIGVFGGGWHGNRETGTVVETKATDCRGDARKTLEIDE